MRKTAPTAIAILLLLCHQASAQTAEALWREAVEAWRAGDRSTAARLGRRILREFPGSPEARRIRMLAARRGIAMDTPSLLDFRRRDVDPVRVTVRADQPADFKLDRRIFGNFLEHLGSVIYGGVSAQVLANTSFERVQVRDEHAPQMRARGWTPDTPFPWQRLNESTEWELIPEAVNTSAALRLSGAGGVGVYQVVALPAHRCRTYEGYLYARADAEGASLRVGFATEAGDVLDEVTIAGIGATYARHQFELSLPGGELSVPYRARFVISTDAARVDLDQCLLMPTDHVEGLDPDIIRVGREWNIPLLRYPGGNFASGYHWEDGVGPLDERPQLPNLAWGGVEYNHFGTDEFMRFCGLIGAEPHICVNIGSGTPEEAAHWVEYLNGSTQTAYGRRRADNGHPEPYRVKVFEIGNEIYGNWQIGHCDAAENARRYRAFVEAMKAVDPGIECIANGQSARNDWNDTLIRDAGDILEAISLHPLIGPWNMPDGKSAAEIHLAFCAQADDFFRQYLPELKARLVADGRAGGAYAAVTEWGIIGGGRHPGNNPDAYPHGCNQSGAVYAGCFLNGLIRAADFVRVANITGFLHGGGMKKRDQVVYVDPQYWVSKMYADEAGDSPVAVSVVGPGYDLTAQYGGGLHPVSDCPLVDVAATMRADGAVAVFLVNRDFDQDHQVALEFAGMNPGQARFAQVVGDSPFARNSIAQRERVKPVTGTLPIGDAPLRLPACSVTCLVVESAGN